MTLELCNFFVPGRPRPGGSKTAIPIRLNGALQFRGPVKIAGNKVYGYPQIAMIDSSGAEGKAWRDAVAAAGRQAWARPPLDQALEVNFVFRLERPKAHYRTGKFAHLLRPDAPEYPGVKPDVLKFARAAEDALTGIIWTDDTLIVVERLCKFYCEPGQEMGLYVEVWPKYSVAHTEQGAPSCLAETV